MTVLDVERLLEPISPELPCGEDLEYDQEFGDMERAAQPVAEQQFGETVIEGQEPEWREVRRLALSLFTRTKDLRVAVVLARAAVRIDGLAAFRDALAIVRDLVERFWEDVHPRLDPDDDNDPTMRVNILCTLCDEDACLRAVSEATLIELAALGKLSYRDYLIASGELTPREDEQPVGMSTIEAALLDVDVDDLQAQAELLQGAIEDSEALETSLTEHVGVGQAATFEPLVELLRNMHRVLADELDRRGAGEAPDEEVAGEEGLAGPAAVDQVRSRQDVIRLLDKICEYYERHEPASPVPLLMKRAKRIAGMGFMELLRELAPGGVSEAEAIAGASERKEEDEDED